MNAIAMQQTSLWRYLWFVALIGLPVLSWQGMLDQYSADSINSSISSAGLIYGTARGINALVSLLQGTELNVPFLTFSIGEVLDPVNDLIERFSDIILLALGSLALQKILLAVVSATMFNILLSAVAVCTGLSLCLGNPKLSSILLRTFLVIAFFRFSLGFVVFANSCVDSRFLDDADQQRHIAMEKFQGELREVDTLTQKRRAIAATMVETQQAISKNERKYHEDTLALDQFDATIKTDTKNLHQLIEQAGGLCTSWDILQSCPADVKHAKAQLTNQQKKRSALVEALEVLQNTIADQRENIVCLEKKNRGEYCNLWDRLPDAPDISLMRQKLDGINANINDFAENTINLLVSLLLKTVAIPLLFLYLLLKIVRMNWARI